MSKAIGMVEYKTVSAGVVAADAMVKTSEAVSYTHLDVYKRQLPVSGESAQEREIRRLWLTRLQISAKRQKTLSMDVHSTTTCHVSRKKKSSQWIPLRTN